MYSSRTSHFLPFKTSSTLILFATLGLSSPVYAAPSQGMPPMGLDPMTPMEQQSYGTPEEAVDALVQASRDNNKSELFKVLGPNADKLISSGDKVADRKGRSSFLAAYAKAHDIKSVSDGHDVLVVGDEEWPMPIPLVRGSSGWAFDTDAGQEEILNRRIGRNELNVLQVCRAYVEAQQEYAALKPEGVLEYAQHFQSSAGHHDGLFWQTSDDQTQSPLGPLMADATAEGYSEKVLSKHIPYHGYFFKILTSQGSNASGGARDFVVNGHMTGGFALIAFPARYGDSGVMTFIVSQNGIVYEKNLGEDTLTVANAITQFDPDQSWNVVKE